MKKKIKYIKMTEKELNDYRISYFQSGLRSGKKEIIDQLIKLLELDNRYQQHEEDY